MKKAAIVLAGLYLYAALLTILLPMLLSWAHIPLSPAADAWLDAHYLRAAGLFLLLSTAALLAAGLFAALRALTRPPLPAAECRALLAVQTAMRLVQIPGYAAVFALSLLFLLTVFTLPFTLAFFLLDALSVLITGLFSVSVYVSLYRSALIDRRRALCCCLLSFVFCADAAASVLCWRYVARSSQRR